MKPPITNEGKSTLSMRYPFGLNGMFAIANIPINQTKTVNAIADHINVILLRYHEIIPSKTVVCPGILTTGGSTNLFPKKFGKVQIKSGRRSEKK